MEGYLLKDTGSEIPIEILLSNRRGPPVSLIAYNLIKNWWSISLDKLMWTCLATIISNWTKSAEAAIIKNNVPMNHECFYLSVELLKPLLTLVLQAGPNGCLVLLLLRQPSGVRVLGGCRGLGSVIETLSVVARSVWGVWHSISTETCTKWQDYLLVWNMINTDLPSWKEMDSNTVLPKNQGVKQWSKNDLTKKYIYIHSM